MGLVDTKYELLRVIKNSLQIHINTQENQAYKVSPSPQMHGACSTISKGGEDNGEPGSAFEGVEHPDTGSPAVRCQLPTT